MARVLTVDDHALYAELIATFLTTHGGHTVKSLLNPISHQDVLDFDPDVLVVALVRRIESLGHGPMHDFYSEVEGAHALRDLANSPETHGYPLIVTTIGVREDELPPGLDYKGLCIIPHEMEKLLTMIRAVARKRD